MLALALCPARAIRLTASPTQVSTPTSTRSRILEKIDRRATTAVCGRLERTALMGAALPNRALACASADRPFATVRRTSSDHRPARGAPAPAPTLHMTRPAVRTRADALRGRFLRAHPRVIGAAATRLHVLGIAAPLSRSIRHHRCPTRLSTGLDASPPRYCYADSTAPMKVRFSSARLRAVPAARALVGLARHARGRDGGDHQAQPFDGSIDHSTSPCGFGGVRVR